jgi:uncharacterized tellurite resistance protein B-like protein
MAAKSISPLMIFWRKLHTRIYLSSDHEFSDDESGHGPERLVGAMSRLAAAQFESELEHFLSAALLVHAIPIDGVVRDEEMQSLNRILIEDFDLKENNANKLVAMVKDRNTHSDFFPEIVRRAKTDLTHVQKRNIVSQLWEVVFSDGHLHETESNLVLQVGVDIGLDVEEACGLMTSNQ